MNTFLDEAFNSDEEVGGASFDLLPPGDYEAQVVEATVSQMNNGNGSLIKLRWQIQTGEFENRLVFQNITFIHRTSEQAQSIGRRTLKDLCDAIGHTGQLQDTSLLCFKPAIIRVGVEHDKNGVYAAKNRVNRVMPLDDAPAPPAPAPVAVAAKPGSHVQDFINRTKTAPWHGKR